MSEQIEGNQNESTIFGAVNGMEECPKNKSEWDVASHKLQCVLPNSYHCMLNEQKQPIEQCLGKIWIQEGFCPEYNAKAGRIDVRSCSSDGCPKETYWSSEVYKYSTCISERETIHTTALSPSSGSPTYDANLSPNTIAIYVIVPILIIALSVVIVIIVYRKRRSGHTAQPTTRNDQSDAQENLLLATANATRTITENDYTRRENQDGRRNKPIPRAPKAKESHSIDSLSKDEWRTEFKQPQAASELKPLTTTDSFNTNRSRNPIQTDKEKSWLEANDDLGEDKTSDAEKLIRSGVLIYVFSDKLSSGIRLSKLDKSGLFGQSVYIGSLALWEPEQDVSLYLFRQPMDEIIPEKLEEMYKMTNQFPKAYFAMQFSTEEWRKYELKLEKYNLFSNASIIKI